MYFWRTAKLASDLKAGAVPNRDKRNYLIAWIVITTLGGYAALAMESESSALLILETLLVLLINVAGVLVCYGANRAGDGRDFVERFVCMTLPLFIRVVVALLAFMVAYVIVGYAIRGQRFESFLERHNVADVLFAAAFEAAFYWRMRLHFLRIAGVSSDEQPQVAGE